MNNCKNEKTDGKKIKVFHISVAAIVDRFYDIFFTKQLDAGIDIKGVMIPYSAKKIKNDALNRFKFYDKKIPVFLFPIKSEIDRILYFSKIRKYAKKCESIREFYDCNLIHAHHLYSDGGVAYLLHKKYKIPYVVSVRHTDVEYFMKYFLHTKHFIFEVLKNAEQIICINPNLKAKLLKKIKDKNVIDVIANRIVVLPNGVDDFWIKNINRKTSNNFPKIKLIQVGSLINRKNHKSTIKAVKILKDRGYDVELDIVGEGKKRKYLEILIRKNNLQNNIHFYGFIKDKQELLELYRKSDFFILPSFIETFGIVYIEAMSQGLPVIYSRNQGIDGYFGDNEIGHRIDPYSPKSIAEAVISLIKNYMDVSLRCSEKAKDFDWSNIVIKYKEIYNKAINN